VERTLTNHLWLAPEERTAALEALRGRKGNLGNFLEELDGLRAVLDGSRPSSASRGSTLPDQAQPSSPAAEPGSGGRGKRKGKRKR